MPRGAVLTRDARLGWAGLIAGAASLGWAGAAVLGDLSPLAPVSAAVAAAAVAAGWGWFAAPRLGGAGALRPWWIGVAALALPWLADRVRARLAGFSFERVGLLFFPGGWVKADPGTYLVFLGVGALAGAACLLVLWSVRHDRRAVWTAGLTSLALGALWRTVVHPPSGDEPTLLFAAWSWLETGSTDLTKAWGGAAEILSRAGDFRADLIRDHTIGPLAGPRYTYHGILLPHLYGLLLCPLGRFGLSLALVGVAAAGVAAMARTAEALTGRPVSATWIAALLVGSPFAVYTVFLGPDMPAAVLFAFGCLGLARGKPALVAVVAAALPWLHHKCAFPAGGLALAAFMLSPRAGIGVSLALAASVIPEAVWISGKLGLPLWPPLGVLGSHAKWGESYSLVFWFQAVPGILVDRYAGLIWAPAFVLGMAGCAWWATGRPARAVRPARAILLAAVPYLLVLLTFSVTPGVKWCGGNGAPSRQMLPILPAFALGIVALDAGLRAGRWRTAWRAAVWLGVAHAHLLLFVPPVAFESAKLKLEAAAAGRLGVDPLAILPAISYLPAGWWPGWGGVAWSGVIVVAWIAIWRRLPRR